jgi:hypothetical protein
MDMQAAYTRANSDMSHESGLPGVPVGGIFGGQPGLGLGLGASLGGGLGLGGLGLAGPPQPPGAPTAAAAEAAVRTCIG